MDMCIEAYNKNRSKSKKFCYPHYHHLYIIAVINLKKVNKSDFIGSTLLYYLVFLIIIVPCQFG